MFFTKDLYDIFIRCSVSIIVLYSVTKVVGKKQISQLNMFDYIVGITIGSIAADLSLELNVLLRDGILALIMWGMLPIVVAFLNIKSMKIRKFTEGKPTILIKEGEIIKENLKEVKFTINDLLEELRVKGYFNVFDIKYAILETNGQITVLEKNKTLYINIIIDGELIYKNLDMMNISKEWVINELKKNNIENIENVFFASIDENKKLFIDKINSEK